MKKRFHDSLVRLIQKIQFGDSFTKIYLLNRPCPRKDTHEEHAYAGARGYVPSDRVYFCKGLS